MAIVGPATRPAIVLLALVLACVPVQAARPGPSAVVVALTAPTHSPKVSTKWTWSVRAVSGGKPAAGRVTAQIVDPVGGVHPVAYGSTTKPIVNRPFTGSFRDYVRWPASSRGIPLTFRVTVVAGGARKVLSYPVTPRP